MFLGGPFGPADDQNPRGLRRRIQDWVNGTSRLLLYRYITPYALRAESRGSSSNSLDWSYDGDSPIGIYRALHGQAFRLIAVVVSPLALHYDDNSTTALTWYDYKISDDGGITFSNTVSVITQCYPTTTGSLQSTTSPALPQFPTAQEITPDTLNQLSQQVESTLNNVVLYGVDNPCLACIENGGKSVV